MIKKLLSVNLISAVLLIMSLISYFLLESIPVFCVFMLVTLIYLISANYSILLKKTDYLADLRKYTRYKFFEHDINMLMNAYKSLELRESYINELKDENISDIYEKLKMQVINNINSAGKFCKSYDYVHRSKTDYLHELASESNELSEKFNSLIEELIDVDNSVQDVDTSYIDCLLESLKTVKQ